MMSAKSKTRPLLEVFCKILNSRTLHTTPIRSAQGARPARPAPASRMRKPIKVYSAASPRANGARASVVEEESLPPLDLLQEAFKSGALSGISPEDALSFLREFRRKSEGSTLGWERQLCKDHNVLPAHLTLLGRISLKFPPSRIIGSRVLLCASALGDVSATLYLINSTVDTRNMKSPELAPVISRLKVLATRPDPEPAVMLIYGRLLSKEGKIDEALKCFRFAAAAGEEFDGLGDALYLEGQILMKKHERVGAEKALRRAALEFDEPAAYYSLAEMTNPELPEHEQFMLKAAASGMPQAAEYMGLIEKDKIQNLDLDPEKLSLKHFQLAAEWFKVAAAGGIVAGMNNLAMIYKAGGKAEEGLKWLEMAEAKSRNNKQTKEIRHEWANLTSFENIL